MLDLSPRCPGALPVPPVLRSFYTALLSACGRPEKLLISRGLGARLRPAWSIAPASHGSFPPMHARFLLVVPLTLALASTALAQGTGKPEAQKEKSGAAAASGGPRKDPAGVKGISPFWEQLKKGDDLYVARDFDGAIAAYREAITKEPQRPLGHYRIGEAHLAKNDTAEAEAAWVSALRFVGQDHVLKAKILFVLADLRERQKSYDDATDRWNAYGNFAQQQAAAKAYPNTANDRKQKIATWKKLLEDYSAVKKRIETRLREADDKAKKDAEKHTKDK